MEDSEFTTPKELGRLLAESNACQKCIVKQLFRYAFGREETAADQPAIEALLAKFRESGYRFRELIVALVTSDLFLQRAVAVSQGVNMHANELSRRTFLRGVGLSGAAITVGLPAFESQFNASGTAYAARGGGRSRSRRGSSSGSTATGSSRSIGFRARTAATMK